MDFPIPESLSQFKRLLGLFAYNAKCVADYSNKAAPLLAAQKQLAFPLNQASRMAIATLEKEVASAVLWLPRTNEPIILQTDASGTGIGAKLSEGNKPVGFFTRNLKQRNGVLGCRTGSYGYLHCFSDLLRKSRVFSSHQPKGALFHI